MSSRSLNNVQLIGNLMEKPQIKQTSRGTNFSIIQLITDREWKTSSGEERKESEKHSCIAWDKLSSIASEILDKGDLVYVEGRLDSTKNEIVVEHLIKLNAKE